MCSLLNNIYSMFYSPSQFPKIMNVVFNHEITLQKNFPEPGLFKSIHKNTKDIYPSCFGGIKVTADKNFNQYIQCNINFHQPLEEMSSYKPYHKFIFESRRDDFSLSKNGFSNLLIRAEVATNYNLKLLTHFNNEDAAIVDFHTDYYGDTRTASLVIADVHPEEMQRSEIAVQLLEKLTEKVALGVEVVLPPRAQLLSDISPLATLVGRLKFAQDAFLSGSFGSKGVQICLSRNDVDGFALGSIIEWFRETEHAIISLASSWSSNGYTACGAIDSNGIFGMNFSKALHQEYVIIKVTLSALTDFREYIRFGAGLSFEL